MIQLEADDSDAPGYIEEAQTAIRGAAGDYRTREVYIVKINNWFGPRWLGFSHKILGVAGVHLVEDFVVPGFVPARVLSETAFVQDASGNYTEAELKQPIHVDQMGSMNRCRRVATTFPDATLFWWTACTKKNRKGALMCYHPKANGDEGWYVGFSSNGSWRVSETVGISRESFRAIRQHGAART